MGSYMVRPVLQDKITSDRERLLPYIRPLYEVVYTSGPDGIRAYPSHQVFGFAMSPRPQQTYRQAGFTLFAIT